VEQLTLEDLVRLLVEAGGASERVVEVLEECRGRGCVECVANALARHALTLKRYNTLDRGRLLAEVEACRPSTQPG